VYPISAAITQNGFSPIGLLLLTGKEAMIGAALGLLLGAPFWALDVAGDVLDAQRGATQGRLNDPAGFEDVSITGTMLVVTGIALFVMIGGLETLADLLYTSWALWRPLGPPPKLDDRLPLLLLGFLDRVTRQGVILAFPAVAAMLLADGALMALARMAPQARIDDLAFSVRNVIFFIFMVLYAFFLLTYMRKDLATLPGVFELMHSFVNRAPGTSSP
jgi:type III secretion protein T